MPASFLQPRKTFDETGLTGDNGIVFAKRQRNFCQKLQNHKKTFYAPDYGQSGDKARTSQKVSSLKGNTTVFLLACHTI